MEAEEKIRLKMLIGYNSLLGEFIGTLEGVCSWEIPEELKLKLQAHIEELRLKCNDE